MNWCFLISKQTTEVAKKSNPDARAPLDQLDKPSKPTRWEYILRFSSPCKPDLQQFHFSHCPSEVRWAAELTLQHPEEPKKDSV